MDFVYNESVFNVNSIHLQGPVVSVDDYKELHAVTKKWIDEKRAAAQNRDFPNSVEELKSLMASMEKLKSKEMPAKRRDMNALSELYEQLQALKAKKPSTPAVPSEMEYSKLEEVQLTYYEDIAV